MSDKTPALDALCDKLDRAHSDKGFRPDEFDWNLTREVLLNADPAAVAELASECVRKQKLEWQGPDGYGCYHCYHGTPPFLSRLTVQRDVEEDGETVSFAAFVNNYHVFKGLRTVTTKEEAMEQCQSALAEIVAGAVRGDER